MIVDQQYLELLTERNMLWVVYVTLSIVGLEDHGLIPNYQCLLCCYPAASNLVNLATLLSLYEPSVVTTSVLPHSSVLSLLQEIVTPWPIPAPSSATRTAPVPSPTSSTTPLVAHQSSSRRMYSLQIILLLPDAIDLRGSITINPHVPSRRRAAGARVRRSPS